MVGRNVRFAAWRNYTVAVLVTAAALGIRLLLAPTLGTRIPYATFYAAVTIATVLGGPAPGILATVLGGAGAAYFIVPPVRSFAIIGSDHQLGFALYLMVSGILIGLSEMQRRARTRAEAATALAEERFTEIREQVRLREEAEKSERQQKEWFQTTLSSIGDAVIATDGAGRIVFLNRVAEALTGWSGESALGQPIERVFDIRNETTGATVENPVTKAIREGRVVGLANHTVLISKDGRIVPIDDSGAPILDRDGKATGAVLVFRDVSEAKLREADLRNRERMINLAHDAIIVTDAERRVTSWNAGATEIYGWTPEEARGRNLHELLKTRGQSLTLREIGEVLDEQGRWDGELLHTSKCGAEVISDSRIILIRTAAGAVGGIMEINRDMTARLKTEEDLKRTAAIAAEGQRTLEALMDHIPEGIAIADAPAGKLLMISRHGALMAGKPASELLNKALPEHPATFGIYRPDGQAPASADEVPLARAIVHGETTIDEQWAVRRSDGSLVPVRCVAAPIRGEDGQITGGLISWRDVSQWETIQEKLRQTAKLESLGVLAGGIAHDFNNLLTGVLGNASLLMDVLPAGTFEARCAEQVSIAAQRAAKLTQQMLAYSGKGRFVTEHIDVSEFIRETATLIQASIPKHVQLRLELADGLPPIEADASQLQQLVMNLIINGAEAIGPDGGRLRVVTRTENVDHSYIRSLTVADGVAPGPFVVIEVQDTGSGMDEQTLSKIFDPFFTTKFTGRGLGLAAVHGIVRGHHGAIKVYSAPGVGTTFRVLMPAASTPALLEELPADEIGALSGDHTVLVIDDEDIIRTTARTALEMLGYRVLIANDGGEALHMFRMAAESVSLIILDMTMPGLSGEETMRRLREIKPDIPIILSSGFSETEALSRFGNLDLAGFLQKPYSVGALAQKVKRAAQGAH